MKTLKWFFILSTAGLIFSSCERIPMSEYELAEYDGQLNWQQVTDKAEWSERFDLAAVSYNNKLWVAGGYNPGQVKGDTYYEDVWSSADGKEWTQVNESAPWLGRRGHRMVTFNDGAGEAMYLIGGFSVNEATGYRQYCNDVWRSTDGATWTEIKPNTTPELTDSLDWLPRMQHACFTVNQGGQDYIYIVGGRSQLTDVNVKYASVYLNDVWRSTDAIHWEKLLNDDYGIRAEHAWAVDPNTGRIYIHGGNHGVIFETEEHLSHPSAEWQYLWYSDNGTDWNYTSDLTAVEEAYLFRAGHQMMYYDGKLWTLPGKTVSIEHYEFSYEKYYSTWTYEEPETWGVDSKATAIDARHNYAAVVHNDKIYVLGGFTGSNAQSNDVWTAEKF